MKTNIILSLDSRKIKKDGTCPIIMRLSHSRKTTSISTGYSVHPKFWDDNKKAIRKTYTGVSSVTRLNNQLNKMLSQAKDIIVKLDESDELNFQSITQLRLKIDKAGNIISLTKFLQSYIKHLEETQHYGNAKTYRNLLYSLKKYFKREDFAFNEINLSFLKSFEAHYISKGNSVNGLAGLYRSLRSILNKAGAEGDYDKSKSPFLQYKIVQIPTAKRALQPDSIAKIISLSFEQDHIYFNARNIFVLSYYLWGMNIRDMAYLKVEDIMEGRISYQRKKTKKLYDIKIQPFIQPIINYYIQGKQKDDFVLPIIHSEKPKEQYQNVSSFLVLYNRYLKRIAEICEIEGTLTSYVARHSFASNAESLEIPVQAISKMLGHSRISTTEIYLKGFSSNSIDTYHERLVNSIPKT